MEATENNTQPVIGEFDGTEGLSEQSLKGMLMADGPILDTDFAMVGG